MFFHCRELCLYCVAIARRRAEHPFVVTYFKERRMTKRTITQDGTVNPKADSAPVNALKCQFLTDMELAGMGAASRKRYLYVVEGLIKHYWCCPAELTEQQVCDYMLEHHRQGPAKGTFKATHFGLRFFFRQTLGRDWDLFKKK
jgi:hypothetical protein